MDHYPFGETTIKIRNFFLLALCLWATGCVPSLATPAVTEPSAAQLTLSAAPLRPTNTLPSATALPPTATPVPPSSAPGDEDVISSQNVDRVALLNRLGNGMVDDIAYAPDGKTLAVVTSQGVYLYDAQTLTEIASFPNAGDIYPVQIAYNRQGDLLALGNLEAPDICRLVLWRFSEGRWQQDGQVDAYIECLADALSPDGEFLAAPNYDTRLVTVWRTRDLDQVQTFPLEYSGDIYSILIQLAFSGENTLAIEEGNMVSVYNLKAGKLLHRLEEPGMYLHHLAISQDGNVVAARDAAAQKILVWNLGNKAAITLEDAYEDWLTGAPLLLSPKGDLLAIGHNNPSGGQPAGWVDVWQLSDRTALAQVANPEWTYSPEATFHPDGSTLITWLEGVDFWQAQYGTRLASLSGYERHDGVVSPDGVLLADTDEGQIQLVRLSDGQVVHALKGTGETGPGTQVFSPDSRLLASIHIPGMVEIWSVADGSLEKSYEIKGNGDHYAILPGGNFMVVEDTEGITVSLLNLWDGAILKTYPSPIINEYGGLLASISPDGKLLALGATNSPLEVWQDGKDAPLYTLTSPFEWTAISFSPDGKSLVTAADAVQVWKASDGKLHFSPTGDLTSYRNALFSPDGAQMVTTDQGVIHLWDMRDGALLQSLEALPPALFSPDGAMLITSGEGVVGFWQVSDGILLRSMEAATLPAAFSSDGRTLISMRDGVVETWGVPAP